MKRVVAIGDLTGDAPAGRHFVEHDAPLTKKRIAKTKPLPSGAARVVGAPVAAATMGGRSPANASIAAARGEPTGASSSSLTATPASLLTPSADDMHRASSVLPWVAGALGVVALGALAWAVYATEASDAKRKDARQ